MIIIEKILGLLFGLSVTALFIYFVLKLVDIYDRLTGNSVNYTDEEIKAAEEEVKAFVIKLQQHNRDTVMITPIALKPSEIMQSKFGGQAYWPQDQEYPVSEKGKPLTLLAQLNFNEIPNLERYPDKGLLQFFIDNGVHSGLDYSINGQNADEIIAKNYRVIYHQNPTNTICSDIKHVGSSKYNPVKGEYSLQYKMTKEPVCMLDHKFDRLLNDAVISELASELIFEDDISDYCRDDNGELIGLLPSFESAQCSKVGGYAYFSQEDPRSVLDGELAEEWLLLFQMHSSNHKDVNIMWGDYGVANFFIKREDLAKRDFSRVWYNWDCH